MKRRRSLLVLAAVILLLVGMRWIVQSAKQAQVPASGPAWIWAEPRGEHGTPMAFFAVKDFKVGFKADYGLLEITADEEYQVALNGRGFAVGGWRAGGVTDRYRVEGLLSGGDNRLRVELRSTRGVGAFRARLTIEGKRGQVREIVSDESWRIARRWSPEEGFASDERPVVWGRGATGRWPAEPPGRRALTLRMLQGGRSQRVLYTDRWRRTREPWQVAEPHGGDAIGPWVIFDFGRVVTGYLNLKFADAEPGYGFVYHGVRQPKDGVADRDEVIIRVPGRDHWAASYPATFRFLTVVGAPQVISAEVLPVDKELAAHLLDLPKQDGLFGVAKPRTLVSPVEDEVWSELESIPGVARGKER